MTKAAELAKIVDASGNIVTSGTVEPAGDTAAGDNAAIGFTSAEGIVITGQGSTNDVTIKNDADADVIEIPTGTTNVTVAGTLTATGFIIGSADINENDLESIDGITAGTIAASKAAIVDTNKDITGFRNITLTGELDAATLDISGNADIDGTLEADAMTLNGTAITATATLDTGISNNNVPKFTSGVVDDDFLRVNGTAIEGRSASEVLSDIGASAVAGSSSIVTTGALNAGSITSGFGTIDTGSSTITTTGAITGGSLVADNITIDGTEIDLSSGDLTIDVAGDIILDADDGDIQFKNGGTLFGSINSDASSPQAMRIQAHASNGDISFKGNDGGSTITALTLDMSDAGTAKFNHDVKVGTTSDPSHGAADNNILAIGGSQNNGSGVLAFIDTAGNSDALLQADNGSLTINVDSSNATSDSTLQVRVDNSEKLRVDSSGNVGIGTSNPQRSLSIGTHGSSSLAEIAFGTSTTGNASLLFGDSTSGVDLYNGYIQYQHNGNNMLFATGGGSERMRIDASGRLGLGLSSPDAKLHLISGDADTQIKLQSAVSANATTSLLMMSRRAGAENQNVTIKATSGNLSIIGDSGYGKVTIGKTATDNSTAGIGLFSDHVSIVRSGGSPMILNRVTNDGQIVSIRQDNTEEGSIAVSGNTVTYGGFSGLHESSGIATDTPIGTVVSTIDELDVYFAKQGEGDLEEDNPKAGQTRADHAKVKVSDTEGDKAVYGVVGNFNAQGKVNVASVGIGSVRVTGVCEKGDLLESNGDGTAKVQSDDIVRSKTIGKVTIGNSSTDVKLVSCVLYCG